MIMCAVLWLGISIQAAASSISLTHDTTVSQVVGTKIVFLIPAPEGRIDSIDNAAVIGDSRAAVYGALGSQGYCWQSEDSLANLLTQMPPMNSGPLVWRVANLACSGATVPEGLLGPQVVNTSPLIVMPAQVGRLKRMPNLQLVVVYIGANDVNLPDQVAACIAIGSCNNSITAADFQLRLTTFTSNFEQLMQQLFNLPTHPKVLVNLGYAVMSPSAGASNAHCLSSTALTAQDIQLLGDENDEVNDVLIAATAQFAKLRPGGFATADPQLTELCQPNGPEGPEIQPIWTVSGQANPYALHPTGAGAWAIAITDRDAIEALESGSTGS